MYSYVSLVQLQVCEQLWRITHCVGIRQWLGRQVIRMEVSLFSANDLCGIHGDDGQLCER
mgnify:FL=1